VTPVYSLHFCTALFSRFNELNDDENERSGLTSFAVSAASSRQTVAGVVDRGRDTRAIVLTWLAQTRIKHCNIINHRHCHYCVPLRFVNVLTLSTPAVPHCCCSKGSVPYWSIFLNSGETHLPLFVHFFVVPAPKRAEYATVMPAYTVCSHHRHHHHHHLFAPNDYWKQLTTE